MRPQQKQWVYNSLGEELKMEIPVSAVSLDPWPARAGVEDFTSLRIAELKYGDKDPSQRRTCCDLHINLDIFTVRQ